MQKIKEIIAKKITEIISNTGYKTDEDEILSFIDIPVDSKMGDLALPCFKLARIMRSAPPKIALELKESIGELPFIKRVEAVGGYLNFFVDAFYYKELLDRILFDADYGRSEVGRGKVVCLDFSSCNIAKRFHVGHIGSTTIGNALRNIYAFCGYKCVAINHLGDWGTNFGKMIAAYKLYSRKEKVDERGINELVDIYVRFNDEEKKNNALSDMARNAFTKLENGDEEYLEIWQYFKDISIKEYNKTYELLGISFDSYNGEAFFSDKIPGVIEELRQKNLLEKDNGAFIVRLEDYNLTNTVVLKSDGSSLYVARDIAAAIWRKKEYDFDKCIYVTSAGQSLHFAQCLNNL
mgnify:FL=1